MTRTPLAGPDVAPAPLPLGELRAWVRRIDGFSAAVATIMALQAVWMGLLMRTGWYYQADFDNLASASGQPLSLSYLTQSQGGHLDVVGRLVLWLLNRAIPLNYGATIVLRLIAQAVATYLLARLLSELVGRRRGVLGLLTLFVVSPMLVQSTLWLTSSINFLLSELLVLAALRCHVRYAVTHRLRWAAGAAAAMLLATLVAEQAAVSALVLPLLTFGFLSDGTIRERWRAVWRGWPEWGLIAVPILAFAGFYFSSGKYATHSGGFGAADAFHLIGAFWFDTLIPGLFGGPLAWSAQGGNYFAFSNPPVAVRVAALTLLVLAVGWTVRRTRWRAALGWCIPFLVSGIGLVFVGVARYKLFGEFAVSRHFEYAAYAAVPAAVGVALALWPTGAEEVRGRVSPAAVAAEASSAPIGAAVIEVAVKHWLERSRRAGPDVTSSGRGRAAVTTGWVVVAVVTVLSLISGGTYAHQWSQSPSKTYVGHLSATLAGAGSEPTVFDTLIANDVVPGIQLHRHVSDLLDLMGAHVRLNNGPPPVHVVDAGGRLVPASFATVATVHIKGHNTFCNDLVSGQVTKTQRLTEAPHENEWFLRLTYFEQRPTAVSVHLVTAQHEPVAPAGGARVELTARAGNYYLRFPVAAPVAVRVHGLTPDANVCLTNVALGFPFPAR